MKKTKMMVPNSESFEFDTIIHLIAAVIDAITHCVASNGTYSVILRRPDPDNRRSTGPRRRQASAIHAPGSVPAPRPHRG